MKPAIFLLIMAFLPAAGCSHPPVNVAQQRSTTVAFGSCLRQWQPQPIWRGIAALKPELFVFLGDNVYTDVGKYRLQQEPRRIAQAYRDLRASGEFQGFLESAKENHTAIYAVWDDHDYGRNDGGADYVFKLASKKYFLQFFDIHDTVTNPNQPGIYRSERLDLNGIRVQLLLLDTRSFRSPLRTAPLTAACPVTNFATNDDPDATVLGEAQWEWLESELKKPADVRILASSIQFIPMEHCYEKWENFPRERKRMFELLKKTRANGVIVISGDRHLAEISAFPSRAIGYPLYEVTSSGLNSAMGNEGRGRREQNRFRETPENVRVDNFGTIQMTRGKSGVELKLQIRDETGRVLQEKIVPLNSLSKPPS